MFQKFYDLIVSGVFDGVVTPFQSEVCEVLATLGSLAIVALPYAVIISLVFWVVRLFR